MFLRSLELVNFKNYAEAKFEFCEEANCLTGNNGSGKTNILDAIHYLSLCRSYFTATDQQNIMAGSSFFMVQGIFKTNGVEDTITCSLKASSKKIFRRNGKEYGKLNEHIGLFPVTMIAPVDQELITGLSESRRRFMDRIISQTDKTYLENLVYYYRALEHRNALLKAAGPGKPPETSALELWNEQLLRYGNPVFEGRKSFISQFSESFQLFYNFITGDQERASVDYHSQLHESSMEHLLSNSLAKDMALQFTTAGIHKDDLELVIEGMPAKKFGSQGQQKSMVMALKLAHFEYIRRKKNMKPIVMLDDLFDKLDDDRVERIISLIKNHSFGQLFITDTHPGRIREILEQCKIPYYLYAIRKGTARKQ